MATKHPPLSNERGEGASDRAALDFSRNLLSRTLCSSVGTGKPLWHSNSLVIIYIYLKRSAFHLLAQENGLKCF